MKLWAFLTVIRANDVSILQRSRQVANDVRAVVVEHVLRAELLAVLKVPL